jgi:hypothetical protein
MAKAETSDDAMVTTRPSTRWGARASGACKVKVEPSATKPFAFRNGGRALPLCEFPEESTNPAHEVTGIGWLPRIRLKRLAGGKR